MAISNTETFGLCDQVVQLMEDNKTALKDEGLDVANWVTELGDIKNGAVAEVAKQDEMQAATKAQTKVANASVKNVYNKTSTRLDAVIGVLGKTTDAGKQAAKLRSSLIKQSKSKKPSDPNK